MFFVRLGSTRNVSAGVMVVVKFTSYRQARDVAGDPTGVELVRREMVLLPKNSAFQAGRCMVCE